jgi:hypothetical protein
MSGKTSWRQEDCFPIIFETIQKLSADKGGDWVTHDEIVEALLKDINIMGLAALAKIYLYKNEEIDEKSIVANMVAWFSQKITEYEHGELSERYSQYSLIQEAWRRFDRKVVRNRYSYKVRSSPREAPIFVKGGRRRERMPEAKQKEFSKLVDLMKKLGVPGELFREVTPLWNEDKEKALSLLRQRGYSIKLDDLT